MMTFKEPVVLLRSENISGPAGMALSCAPPSFQIPGQAPDLVYLPALYLTFNKSKWVFLTHEGKFFAIILLLLLEIAYSFFW